MKKSSFFMAAAFVLAVGAALGTQARPNAFSVEGYQGTASSCTDIGLVNCSITGSQNCTVNSNPVFQSGCTTQLKRN